MVRAREVLTYQQMTSKRAGPKAKRCHSLLRVSVVVHIDNLKRHNEPWHELLHAGTELHPLLYGSLGINKCPAQPKMPAVEA